MPEQSIAFDRIADRYDETRGGMARGRTYAAELDARLPAGRVLEIGVGTGAVALGLVERGRTVLGVDVSLPMLVRAKDRLGARVAQADGSRLPLRDASVDGICVVWVLALVAEPAGLIAEGARVLRRGGRLAVIANRDDSVETDLDPFMARVETLRADQDRAEHVAAYGAAAGLEVHHVGLATGQPFTQSPTVLADTLEQRLLSTLWDLDDERWERVVVPAIEGLRALPEPDRPRQKVGRHRLVVLAKP